MVASQLARRGVTDERVLEAMREVPREAFVGAGMEEFAYEDSPLPIGAGQTISQPYIVALMIEAAAIQARRPRSRCRHRIGLCGGGSEPTGRQSLQRRAASRTRG